MQGQEIGLRLDADPESHILLGFYCVLANSVFCSKTPLFGPSLDRRKSSRQIRLCEFERVETGV
jgi:hypothetical protein